MKTHCISVGLVQQANSYSVQNNIEKTCKNIQDCAQNGAQLVVLQELHNSLYFCQSQDVNVFDLAETIPGPSTKIYSDVAKKHGIVLVTSLFEKRTAGIYHNTAVVFDTDGSIAGMYRKMHIPDDPAYYEKFYFTPGDMGFTPIKTSLGTLGVLICWDQWFPEAARLMALQGAEILIYPTAIGWESTDDDAEKTRQRNAWIISQQAHAVANGIPVIAVNRCGFEEDSTGVTQGIEFWGSSFVAGQQGEILCELPTNKEKNAVTTITMSRTESVRRIWPYFRDRRIDAYQNITKLFIDSTDK